MKKNISIACEQQNSELFFDLIETKIIRRVFASEIDSNEESKEQEESKVQEISINKDFAKIKERIKSFYVLREYFPSTLNDFKVRDSQSELSKVNDYVNKQIADIEKIKQDVFVKESKLLIDVNRKNALDKLSKQGQALFDKYDVLGIKNFNESLNIIKNELGLKESGIQVLRNIDIEVDNIEYLKYLDENEKKRL